MSKKKTLIVALALVLVCALSVMGTLALLQDQTTAVTNTFVYAGGDDPDFATLSLDEYKVTPVLNNEGVFTGAYTQSTETVKENSYSVLPGAVLPKQAFVTVTEKNAAPGYLYIEVVGALDEVYTWSVDAASWTLLDGVTGMNGGKVYVYKSILDGDEDGLTVDILTGNKITVSKDATEAQLAEASLAFYAYIAQATIGEVSEAGAIYTTCFPAN